MQVSLVLCLCWGTAPRVLGMAGGQCCALGVVDDCGLGRFELRMLLSVGGILVLGMLCCLLLL